MQSKTPLIYIPGLFGSLGTEILPGMGSWHFGPSHYTGKRFVKQLLDYGYTMNTDLFIMFYDWRQKVDDLALYTLGPLIHKVKQASGVPKVNLICHGTGGLIGRTYAQSDSYDYSINHMILIGTPNAGLIPAFSYLNNGSIPITCMSNPDFISLNLNLYLQVFSKSNRMHTPFLRNSFPSFAQFIPSGDYGDYLFYTYKNRTYSIPQHYMSLTNPFLDDLNAKAHLLKDRHIEVTLFGGTGENTTESLEVIPACNAEKYHDGKIINCHQGKQGDGCSLLRSVFAIEGQQYILNSDYGELLLQSANLLPSIL